MSIAAASLYSSHRIKPGEPPGPSPSLATVGNDQNENHRSWPNWLVVLVVFGGIAALVIIIVLLVLYT